MTIAMTLAFSFGAMAASTGWNNAGGTWTYLDSSGNRVRDTWKKSGNYWYYLGSDGMMSTDCWIDGTMYVDINGVMQSNRWVNVSAGTENAPNSDGGWYYLDGSGKVVTSGWKTIGGKKYYFDSDGTMKYGWFTDNDSRYYLGTQDEGDAKTGWLCLDFDKENLPEDGTVSTQETSGSDSSKWFYFQANGKMVKSSGSGNYTYKTINGNRYYFDENGVMTTGWAFVNDATQSNATDNTGISGFKYFGDGNDGRMSKGWRYLTDYPEDSTDSGSFAAASASNADTTGSTDGSWYYFDSNGVPKYLNSQAGSVSAATSKINGQSYFFDEYGKMHSGLIGLSLANGNQYSTYFGSTDADGKMKTDKQTNVVEDNGDSSTFYFITAGDNKGAGYTGEKSKYLYYSGKLVKADKGSTTQVFEVNNKIYLVNESGQIQRSNKCYKSDGEYRYEYYNGTVYYTDTNKVRGGEVTSGAMLPTISYQTEISL